MISDKDLARACVDAYAPGALPTWNTDNVHVFLTMQDGYTVIAFKGSASPQDWWRDFDAFVIGGGVDSHDAAGKLIKHQDLGLVHAGFFGDVSAVFADILAGLPPDPIIVTGHSKGAAESLIFAALLRAATDRVVAKVSTFGTPHPGALGGFLDGIPGTDYRNCSDPVCAVPPYLPHPRDMRDIHVRPMPDDPWGLFAAHHIPLYLEGASD